MSGFGAFASGLAGGVQAGKSIMNMKDMAAKKTADKAAATPIVERSTMPDGTAAPAEAAPVVAAAPAPTSMTTPAGGNSDKGWNVLSTILGQVGQQQPVAQAATTAAAGASAFAPQQKSIFGAFQ